MTLWLDAQISPALALWITAQFGLIAVPLREIGLRDAHDREIFLAARLAGVIVMTKDIDFVRLLREQGPPPHVLWLRCGNTSNARLRTLLSAMLPQAMTLFRNGESLVEISDPI